MEQGDVSIMLLYSLGSMVQAETVPGKGSIVEQWRLEQRKNDISDKS